MADILTLLTAYIQLFFYSLETFLTMLHDQEFLGFNLEVLLYAVITFLMFGNYFADKFGLERETDSVVDDDDDDDDDQGDQDELG
jgi:hypothetical protein